METPFYCQHLSLLQLRAQPENRNHRYLFINMPAYPRPELHVTHLSHCTTLQSLRWIKKDSGFRDTGHKYESEEPKVVWFSLTVTPADLRDAEDRNMIIVHNDREELYQPGNRGASHQTLQDQEFSRDTYQHSGRREECVLQRFASSSAFMSSSRLGSFRFTFSLQDVLDKYSQQFCGGLKPVMRVWKTVLYKKEVQYAVLVHSPTNQDRFSEFPLLQEEDDSICAFRDEPRPHVIWRPQAMCETHSFELIVNQEDNELVVQPKSEYDEYGRRLLRYYVWDHVTLALHVSDQVLRFGDMDLRKNLRFCEMGVPQLRPQFQFQSFEEAQAEVQNLWPLEAFSESDFAIVP